MYSLEARTMLAEEQISQFCFLLFLIFGLNKLQLFRHILILVFKIL
jgi:hypothetical protein